MEFDKRVIRLFEKGCRIIACKSDEKTGLFYMLIRMNKGAWIDGSAGEDDRAPQYEYAECHNSPGSFDDVAVMTLRNGTLGRVKKEFFKSFYEDLFHTKRELKKN